MKESIFLRFTSFKDADRMCHVYSNSTEKLDIGANFLIHGIKNREKCIYISDRIIPKEFINRLSAAGIDPHKARKDGQLKEITIPRKQQEEMKAPDSFISFLAPVIEDISKNSNIKLRILKTREGLLYNHDNLLRREALFDKFSSDKPVVYLCQHDIKKIGSQDLMSLFSTHRMIVFHNNLYDSPFYTPPEEILEKLRQTSSKYELLTNKEREILRFIVNGCSNNEIADDISISVRTVETHRANVMRKLEINKLVDLVKFAIQNGIT